ncbi:hypothetical protein FHR99_003043 [Litorivivens lipolytica]|uniref:DUF4426 domain-containing protein n=1 Tax=Litorivivens lipolytica TaxID=1524264 RepID=A0A7W4Z6Q4_9GAMM|nr:DUF4426 domain-containing protein [Litorivivens lipolytica]MBB3048769.1 hypothetical protein [Litorivivens lipolytica]
MRVALSILLSLCLLGTAQAEQKQRFGNYDVHYSIVNTTFLKPDVAKAYGITRGDDRFILNISVRELQADGSDVARKSEVSGTVFNLIHRKSLDFQEIDERDAIYYIAQFTADNKEMLDFTLSIKPDSSARSYKLQFNKKLYTGK